MVILETSGLHPSDHNLEEVFSTKESVLYSKTQRTTGNRSVTIGICFTQNICMYMENG